MAKKRKATKFSKRSIFFLIIGLFFLVLVLFIFKIIPKNCESDKECFNELAKVCKPVKSSLMREGGLYQYTIKSSKDENCIMVVHLIKTSDSIQPENKVKLENKKMTCEISKELIKSKEVLDWSELTEHCSGKLKEALLEISLEKLYGVVVSNIGDVSMGFRDALETTNQTS